MESHSKTRLDFRHFLNSVFQNYCKTRDLSCYNVCFIINRLSKIVILCFSSKVDTKAMDLKDEVEPNVSLVEELQTKLHELEVRLQRFECAVQ